MVEDIVYKPPFGKSDQVVLRLDYVIEEIIARVGSPGETKRKQYRKGNCKDFGKFRNSIDRERDLNTECEYSVS